MNRSHIIDVATASQPWIGVMCLRTLCHSDHDQLRAGLGCRPCRDCHVGVCVPPVCPRNGSCHSLGLGSEASTSYVLRLPDRSVSISLMLRETIVDQRTSGFVEKVLRKTMVGGGVSSTYLRHRGHVHPSPTHIPIDDAYTPLRSGHVRLGRHSSTSHSYFYHISREKYPSGTQ